MTTPFQGQNRDKIEELSQEHGEEEGDDQAVRTEDCNLVQDQIDERCSTKTYEMEAAYNIGNLEFTSSTRDREVREMNIGNADLKEDRNTAGRNMTHFLESHHLRLNLTHFQWQRNHFKG